jgi:DNA-binding response OmpR family regulator
MSAPSQRRAMLLVITSDDFYGRTLETLFAPAGYHVVRVSAVDEAVKDARAQGPDVVILDADLLRANAAATCARLRELPEVGRRTPLVVSATSPLTQAERRDALRAGAWHLVEAPFNPEDLILRLHVFVEAKREADSFRDSAQWDPGTGLYTVVGLRRQAVEMTSRAARTKEPLACVVFSPVTAGEAREAVLDALVRTLRELGRRSDAIGSLGQGHFAVVAPATPVAGATRMAERLAGGMEAGVRAELRAGFDVATDVSVDETDRLAVQLMEHARAAAAAARQGDRGNWLKRWGNGH